MGAIHLSKLCKILADHGFAAHVEGDDRRVRAVNTLESATDGEITFLSNPKYVDAVAKTTASAIIVREGIDVPARLSAVRCADPYAAVTVAVITLHGYRKHPQWGRSEHAAIDPSATIGKNPNIAAGATIAANVIIGDNCTIYPGCYVADNVTIGDDCTLFPNVVIYDQSVVGNRVTIHAGSVIGQDGLGYAPHNDKWIKIPQVGRVVVRDDVEIGANCAVDRATLGQTEIGSGTKFGNVVVIGHGTRVGPDCMFVGLVGLAGSVTVGRHVTLAGQVGAAGHLTIGDNATVGAQSGIAGNIEPGTTVLGSPAIPAGQWRRAIMALPKVPDGLRRIKDLPREVRELKDLLRAQGGV